MNRNRVEMPRRSAESLIRRILFHSSGPAASGPAAETQLVTVVILFLFVTLLGFVPFFFAVLYSVCPLG